MLYLILHKVRGEPAFDVALELSPGVWIIPTSGHRAYPYRGWRLDDLFDGSDINAAGFHDCPATLDTLPPDWPDHYAANDERPTKSALESRAGRPPRAALERNTAQAQTTIEDLLI
jgi:hypothetical protein